MTDIKKRIAHFLNSINYPISVAIFVYISHTFSTEEVAVFYTVISAVIGAVICDNMKFFMSPLFYFIFMISKKSLLDDRFYSTKYTVAIVFIVLSVVSALIYHFIKYKDKIDFSKVTKSKMFYPYLILCIVLLLNGFFDFGEYTLINLIIGIVMVVSLVVPFLLFTTNTTPSKELKEYIVWVFYIMSILIIVEMITLLIFGENIIVNGEINGSAIVLGWGISNNIGFILAMLMPVHFYLAVTKKHGYIFCITAIISLLLVIFTLSRGASITAGLLFIICTVATCVIKGENLKINRIVLISSIVIGIILFIIFKDSILLLLHRFVEKGLDDNGRFKLYNYGIEKYRDNPLFGAGFDNSYKDIRHPIFDYDEIENLVDSSIKFYKRTDTPSVLIVPPMYHNTIIQMLASCGTFGIVAYIVHRYTTVKLAIEKKSVFTFFMSMSILGLLITSLFDIHFFNIYPLFYYSTILFAIENMGKENDIKA